MALKKGLQAFTGRNETLRRRLFQKTLLPINNSRSDETTTGSQRGTWLRYTIKRATGDTSVLGSHECVSGGNHGITELISPRSVYCESGAGLRREI